MRAAPYHDDGLEPEWNHLLQESQHLCGEDRRWTRRPLTYDLSPVLRGEGLPLQVGPAVDHPAQAVIGQGPLGEGDGADG